MNGDDFSGSVDLETRTGDDMYMRRTAIFSKCGHYRYALGRMWTPIADHDIRKVLVVVGLNPSTANESEDDPTIRRCMDYARRWGHHGLTMLNLFAYRATDPRQLLTQLANGGDIIGGDAQEAALRVFTENRRVLCAWGVHGHIADRSDHVTKKLRELGCELVHLGLTKGGLPKHPLYLRGDLLPQPWEPSR